MSGLFSKLNWRATWMATGVMIVPALVLIILEWIRLGSSPESLSRLSIVLFLVTSCGGLGLLIADGALYGWLAQRSGSPVDLVSMALGGAVSAFILGVILGLSNSVVGFAQNQLAGLHDTSSLLSVMIERIVSAVCPGFLLYVVLGAAGGAIFAVIARNRPVPAQQAAASSMTARQGIPVWGYVAGGGLLLVVGCLVVGGLFLASDPGKPIAGGAGTLKATPTFAPRPADLKGQIVFESTRYNGTGQIYIMNADGSDQTRLTDLPDGVDPVWSPDGTRIVFSSVANKTTIYIYMMNADGSGLTPLTGENEDNLRPVWSPDGRQIAFVSRRDGNQEIYLMNADGSNQTNLTHDPAHEEDPAWSSDGKQIAFASDRDDNWEIYLMNSDGSGLINLTHDPASESGPAWSPDGKQIAFASNRDGNNEIYLMNTDGSGLIRLTHDPFDDISPAWSPDGNWIAFNSNRSTWESVVYVMRADGTDLIRLTETESGDFDPDWSAK